MRMSAAASRFASSRSTNSWGTCADAAATSSTDRACEDGVAQGERAQRVEAHETARGEDADDVTLVVDHRQVVHSRLDHGDARLRRQRVGR